MPEAFSKSDTTCEQEEEEHMAEEEEEEKPLFPPLSPDDPSISRLQARIAGEIPLRTRVSLEALYHVAAEVASSGTCPTLLSEVLDLERAANTDGLPLTLEDKSKGGITSSIAADMDPTLGFKGLPEFERDKLCIKWGERVWNDLTEVTLYSMFDIEHSDEAMILRVKDLV